MKRVIADFAKLPESTRKPLNFKEAQLKHQCVGGYLFYLGLMQQRCPAAEWKDVKEELDKAFMNQFLDAELMSSLSSTVPPGEIMSIGAFRRGTLPCLTMMLSWAGHLSVLARSHLARFEKMQTAALEQKEDELAKAVLAATFNQLIAQLDHDLKLVGDKYSSSKDSEAAEAQKDAKFLRERQAHLA